MPQAGPHRFDFAISFSGGQRAIASEIAAGLRDAGFTVFYDKDQVHELIGEDGESYLRILYSAESRFYVVLVSKEYDQSSWTQLELEAILAREALETTGVLIPVIVDRHRPNWLSSERIYLDLHESNVRDLVEVLDKKARSAPRPAANELRSVPAGYQLRLSVAETSTLGYAQFVHEAKKRLHGLGVDVQDWEGPKSPELKPILRCPKEDRLIALRVKAVIDTLLRRYGPLKGEVEGEVFIELTEPSEDATPSAAVAVLYL